MTQVASPPQTGPADDGPDPQSVEALEQRVEGLLSRMEQARQTASGVEDATIDPVENAGQPPLDPNAAIADGGATPAATPAPAAIPSIDAVAPGRDQSGDADDAPTPGRPNEPADELERSIESAIADATSKARALEQALADPEPVEAAGRSAPSPAPQPAQADSSGAPATTTRLDEQLAAAAPSADDLADELLEPASASAGSPAAPTQAIAPEGEAGAPNVHPAPSHPADADAAAPHADLQHPHALDLHGAQAPGAQSQSGAPDAASASSAPSASPAANLADLAIATPVIVEAPPEPLGGNATDQPAVRKRGAGKRAASAIAGGGIAIARAMASPLRALPIETRDMLGWFALVTLFNAGCLWAFVAWKAAQPPATAIAHAEHAAAGHEGAHVKPGHDEPAHQAQGDAHAASGHTSADPHAQTPGKAQHANDHAAQDHPADAHAGAH